MPYRDRNEQDTIDRFFSHVIKGPKCWGWNAHIDGCGYGIFSVKSKRIRAHRFSFKIHHGPLVKGMEICHRCDNPVCTNPAHLWQGTHGDNLKDCHIKGRRNAITNSKLTKEQIAEIRLARASTKDRKWGAKELAKKFGVNREAVCRIGRGETWQKA